MKLYPFLFAAMTLFALPQAHAGGPPAVVNPYGVFLEGDGVEIEMALYVDKNADGLRDVLLKITGPHAFNAGIDGKTFKYQAVPGGTGVDYQQAGKTRMIARNPWGNSWSLMEVFLDGKTITVQENKTKSKEVRPLHLLTASKASAE